MTRLFSAQVTRPTAFYVATICLGIIESLSLTTVFVLLEEVLPASWKSDLTGEEWHILATPSEDIFSAGKNGTKGNFNHVAKRLFDSQ